jgi:NAD/NADP transhydrogenase alpha subunit
MVGGFVVTDRMLEMFKGKSKQEKNSSGSVGKDSGGSAGNSGAGNSGAGN